MKVPNGLDPRHAALTEPMAVGLHAVESSRITPAHAAVVLGCGPVGLAVIAALAPRRRRVDRRGGLLPHPATPGLDGGSDRGGRSPRGRSGGALAAVDGRRPLVVFEAIGVPGILDQAMLDAPRQSQILVVGVCMEPDTIRPMLGRRQGAEHPVRVRLRPRCSSATRCTRIAEGEFDVAPLITGEVGLDGVAAGVRGPRRPRRPREDPRHPELTLPADSRHSRPTVGSTGSRLERPGQPIRRRATSARSDRSGPGGPPPRRSAPTRTPASMPTCSGDSSQTTTPSADSHSPAPATMVAQVVGAVRSGQERGGRLEVARPRGRATPWWRRTAGSRPRGPPVPAVRPAAPRTTTPRPPGPGRRPGRDRRGSPGRRPPHPD